MTDNGIGESGRGRMPAAISFDKSDLGVSAILFAISAILWWDTTRWPAVPASLAQNAPPTTFPRLLIGVVVVLALLLPFERIWKARGGTPLDVGGHDYARPVVFVTIAVLILAVYLMPILGVFPVMLGASLALPLLWGERRYLTVVLFAVGVTIGVTALFAYGLQVNLGFGLTGDMFR